MGQSRDKRKKTIKFANTLSWRFRLLLFLQTTGCLYQGRHIDSGTEWTDPDDPCMHYKCVSGVVTRSEMKCYAPCSDPSPPRKGQCCPTCLGELQKFPVRTSYFRSVCVCVRSLPRRSGAFVPAGWSSVRSLSRRLPKCTGKVRQDLWSIGVWLIAMHCTSIAQFRSLSSTCCMVAPFLSTMYTCLHRFMPFDPSHACKATS